ncbi:unnamed protein product [Candida verbasci]|uniref:Major facilitator superfamily (MFS) profile domain-containing protein n=1 Tax=Candida verbasci TaxID=1227364 RepID=A0A9W4TR80_9ASCO|nr:unnamed protein product [Candida verbasci]
MNIDQGGKTETKEDVDKNSDLESVLSDKIGEAYFHILPFKKLLICLLSLSLALFASFVDQTSVSIALPSIGQDLNAETTINWGPTASFLANCVCQVLFGRLADIFGRKTILLNCLIILSIGELACGFAQTGVQFYIFKAFTGIGCGGIQSLCMVLLSDVCTLEQRGKYQGLLLSQVGIGNAVGPFLMAAFIKYNSWRNFYHMMCPFVALITVVLWYIIDTKESTQNMKSILTRKEKFKKIDYFGIFFSSVSLVLLLIPISGGGTTYSWDSALVITMFVIGGVSFFIFLWFEYKAELPMIPLILFTRPSLALILGSNFFFGMAYYSFTYYIAYYYQIIRDLDAIHSSILLLPLVLPQSIISIIAGQIISYTGHYYYVIIVGYALWTLASGLTILFDLKTNYGVIVVVLLILGSGVGCTFQPTMVAAQSQAQKAERAVVISTRNVIRSFGGSIGNAFASLIISNSLLKEIKQSNQLPTWYIDYIKSHVYSKIDTNMLNDKQALIVKTMYTKSIRNFFYFTIPLMAICLISNLFVKDDGLKCIDEK